MKLSDYVADYLATIGTNVYGICGAGAMHLNDSICNHPKLKFIACHHEQAAAFAAEAEARVTNKIGLVHVTAGPGGTNAITGIASAWVDSIPMMVIAGQVGTSTLKSNERQLGTNELDLPEIVQSITKYVATVRSFLDIRFHLETAYRYAMHGRRGPVFLEIPLDIQAMDIDPEMLMGETVENTPWRFSPTSVQINKCHKLLQEAKRPVMIVGNGVHLADADIVKLAWHLRIPVLSSWNGSDLMATEDPLYIGRPGLMGDRAGNFAIQNADVILAIGTRLSIPQIGHHPQLFAPNAKLIMVDIDPEELDKPTLRVDLPICADAKEFIDAMFKMLPIPPNRSWLTQCQAWKCDYPVMQPQYRDTKHGINSYFFMEVLGEHLDDDAIVVTDVGAPFISAMQSLRLRSSQRLFHSGGVSAMGYGIPAAMGACFATNKQRQVICLVGDGGAMLNLQELQTIRHHNLPIAIFVFCNNGYMTMQFTQQTHFKREAASSPDSGLSCPNFSKIASAFGIANVTIRIKSDFDLAFTHAVYKRRSGPLLVTVEMPPGQVLAPRVMSRMEDGKFVPTSIDHMWPYLEELETAK